MQRIQSGEGVICKKLKDWGDWQLFWYFEYLEHQAAKVEAVVIELERAPLVIRPLSPLRIHGRPLISQLSEKIKELTRL